jgi:DNA-binding NtrC family response regulator
MRHAVLVVDDDEVLRSALVWVLRDEGYPVSEAPDGATAVQALRAHPEGMVVLLDLMLPRGDGFDVLRAVEGQHTAATRHGYIVVTATYRTMPPARFQQLTRWQIPVFDKPFDLDKLLGAVATANAHLQAASTMVRGRARREGPLATRLTTTARLNRTLGRYERLPRWPA